MNGLELSEKYYQEYGVPDRAELGTIKKRSLPACRGRISCYGFDESFQEP
jgi:hypothetical protein